jgi:membrane protein DedA with SNARE-associated domain
MCEGRRKHGDYVGIALAASLGWAGVLGVGEAAVIAGGIAAAHHQLDLTSLLVVVWAATLVGGTTGWLIGLKGGRRLMTAPGPLHAARGWILRNGDRIYERHGPMAVYFAPSWLAGIHAMRLSRFLPVNAASGLIWTLLLGAGAYELGPPIADVVSGVGAAGLAALGMIVLGAALTQAVQGRRRSH